MKKRILSILLLCCMVLTLLPTTAFAAGEIDEQFILAPGGTYYFDLSAMGIPGTVNDALPDKTMRYVPLPMLGQWTPTSSRRRWQPQRSMHSRANMPTAYSLRILP